MTEFAYKIDPGKAARHDFSKDDFDGNTVAEGPFPQGRAKALRFETPLMDRARPDVWAKRPSSLSLASPAVCLTLAVIDFMVLASLIFAAAHLYHRLWFGHSVDIIFYGSASIILVTIFITVAFIGRGFDPANLFKPAAIIRSDIKHFLIASAFFLAGMYLISQTDAYSRGTMIIQIATGIVTIIMLRAMTARQIAIGERKGIIDAARILLIGTEDGVGDFQRRTKQDRSDLVAFGAYHLPEWCLLPCIGVRERELRDLIEIIERESRLSPPDEILILLPWSAEETIRLLIDKLSVLPTGISVSPPKLIQTIDRLSVSHFGGTAIIRLVRKPLTIVNRIVKRLFDTATAGLLLFALAPAFAFIALLIKLDTPGPVLFRQTRHGFNQQDFKIWKFRTMIVHEDSDTFRQAQPNDSRITRVGTVLRRFNLDEFPQLLNVLAGQMSLVGPRPHAIAHNQEFNERIAHFANRHRVKPGITGWAQVNGFHGETDTTEKMESRVSLDLYYIDNWSLSLDIQIMLQTLFSPKPYRNSN